MKNNAITIENLENRIRNKVIGRKIFAFNSLSSTNEFAKRLVRNGENEGTVVFANQQTKGRGRHQKNWYSPPDTGLLFSIILKPIQPITKLGLISLLASIAVSKSIENMTKLKTVLKWPNDVLSNSKKVCGILIESQFSNGQLASLILGVGVNANQSPSDFPRELSDSATSLKVELGNPIDRIDLLINILHNLEDLYFKFGDGNHDSIIRDWQERCPFIHQYVSVKDNTAELRGIFDSIDEYGRMNLRLESGETRHISVGNPVLTNREAPCYF